MDMLRHPTPPSVKKKPGFAKILGCVMQAEKHGLDYIWIDTCCIDKANSTELQEAINSMWKWYHGCARCYVYMNDVQSGQCPDADDSDFSRSQWFRRGWTLQELLAPAKVTFFAKDWEKIGKKANQNIVKRITHITGIPKGVLSEDGETTSFSVATRMTWASRRSTTKEEDKAYSLMGIFGITFPIIYGGRENVFVKFQKEIMNRHPDQSIFAWTAESAPPTTTAGLLTPSPAYFADVTEISDEVFIKDFAHMIKPDSRPPAHYFPTNLGIKITLPMKPVEGKDDLFLAMLRCALPDKPDRPLCIYLQPLTWTRNQWVRTRIGELIPAPMDDKLFENTQIFVKEDMSFFEPPQLRRTASQETYVQPRSRERAPRSSSVAPAPKRQAVQRSPAPIPRADHRSTPSQHPSPISVPERSRVPIKVLRSPLTDTPPTIRHGRRTNRVTSRTRHNRPISITVPWSPERLRELNLESPSPGRPNQRSMTPQPFGGQIPKVRFNDSQHPQFRDRRHNARSLSPHLVSSDFARPQAPGREPKRFKPRAVPTSRLRSRSLAVEPSASRSPERIEHSVPVGAHVAQIGRSKPSSQARSRPRKATSPSHIPAVDRGRAASRDRGRDRSQKPTKDPVLHDSLPVSPVPTTPSSAGDSEHTASSSSAPPTPPQILAPLSNKFTPILNTLSGSKEDSDPFESSPNHAVELTNTSSAPPTPPQIPLPLTIRFTPNLNTLSGSQEDSDPLESSPNHAAELTSTSKPPTPVSDKSPQFPLSSQKPPPHNT
ncbi:hypothetical protein BU15DRAFT_78487 [Melanogaster broomeanus]|nr:hypothetical protein BU15DRAFT_78487 [Melanogaster broomeanus]